MLIKMIQLIFTVMCILCVCTDSVADEVTLKMTQLIIISLWNLFMLGETNTH